MTQLRHFPCDEFGEPQSQRWEQLCDELCEHEPSTLVWNLSPSRKWELVSAIQKAVRRGDWSLAMQLIAAIESMPAEWAYFWRRLSIVACEDIGSGDATLTTFVIACSKVFTPVKAKSALPTVYSFLVMKMCAVPNRSRTACSLVGIQGAAKAGLIELRKGSPESEIVNAIEDRSRVLERPDSLWRKWQRQNDWRGAGLLRFLDVRLPFDLEEVREQERPYKTICGLPSFSYDMYTRIGRYVLRRLIDGISDAPEIQEFFQKIPVKDSMNAAGEALFFVEGGFVQGEVFYLPVRQLRHQVLATQFGLSDDQWNGLRLLMAAAIDSGIVDRLRGEELDRRTAQGELFPDSLMASIPPTPTGRAIPGVYELLSNANRIVRMQSTALAATDNPRPAPEK